MAETVSFDRQPLNLLSSNRNAAANRRPSVNGQGAPAPDNRANEQAAASAAREQSSASVANRRAADEQVQSQANVRSDLVRQTERNFNDQELQARNDVRAVQNDRDIERAGEVQVDQAKQNEALARRREDRSARIRDDFVQQVVAQRDAERNIEAAQRDPSAPRGSIVDFQA
jgi:hypothetical protein